jgi:hypothetical protein
MNDPVNHPAHYMNRGISCPKCDSNIECIDVTGKMDFLLGNAIKYIWRAPFNDNTTQDLQKAVWYINRYLQNVGGI